MCHDLRSMDFVEHKGVVQKVYGRPRASSTASRQSPQKRKIDDEIHSSHVSMETVGPNA
jgi:hypothetical protein